MTLESRRFIGCLLALSLSLLSTPIITPSFAQIPGGGGNIVVNSTPISNGTNGLCLYDNQGKVGEQACGGGAPSGPAGGDLTGTYPNPTLKQTTLSNGVFQSSATLTQPAAPTGITATGANDGSVNYRYVLVVHGAGTTAASAAMASPFAGNSTLDGTHFNNIPTVTQTGCTGIDIYKTSPGSNVGLIGSTTCGGTFSDTGQTGNNVTATASDTGSGGTTLTGPLVINTGSPTSVFGSAQFGETPQNIQKGQAPSGYFGPVAVLSSSGTNNNALVIQAASTSNDPGILFRNFAGTLTNPISQGAGSGWIAGENYVGGSVNKFYQTTFYEFGGASGSPFTAVASLTGRHQFGVADGNAGGYQGHGFTIKGLGTYPSPLNTFAFLGTNFGDFRLYRTGYPNVQSVDDTTNYERIDLTWASAGTTANIGTVAGGTGVLRPVLMTGSNWTFNSTSQAAGVSSDGLFLVDPTVATNNNQQWSPGLNFQGSVWSTTSVAAARTVNWREEIQTVQGANSSIQNNLVFSANTTGSYSPIVTFVATGTAAQTTGVYINGGALHILNAADIGYSGNFIALRTSYGMGWSSATDPVSLQTAFWQTGAQAVSLGNGTANNASGSLTLTNLSLSGSGQLNVAAMTQTAVAQSGTVCYNSGTGAVTYDATLGCLASTMAVKKNWKDIIPREALAAVLQMKAGSFEYVDGMGLPAGEQIGLSAQQIEGVDRRLVGYRPNGDLAGVRYQQASALYPMAIQQLKADNDNLRAELRDLRLIVAR